MNRRHFLLTTGAVGLIRPAPALAAADTLPLSAPLHIGRVGLRARDAAGLAAWYRRHVGLTELSRAGDRITLGAGSTPLLEISERSGLTLAPRSEAGLYHTAFLLPSRADLARWVARAAEDNFPVDGAADHLVSEAFYLTDPEGNGVEIYADRPATEWRWTKGQVEMASDPVDFDALMGSDPGLTAPFDRAPAGTCVGHVHLKVGAAGQASEWWQSQAGFAPVRQRNGAAFLSTGGYHHHIAVNEWESAGAARRSARHAGLDWVEIVSRAPTEARDLQDDWGTEIRLRPMV